MNALTSDQARQIVATAITTGREADLQPLAVVVLDAGGHLLCFQREDGAGIMRGDVAIAKAWGAIGMGMSSRAIGVAMQDRPAFQNALAAIAQGRFAAVPGGVLVRDEGGKVIGAVGISGDVSDQDELCAIEGIRAAGLAPDPQQASV